MTLRNKVAVLCLVPTIFLVNCARVQAPPPPTTEPGFSQEFTVAGVRVVIAAKAARTLALFAYTTKRFGPDSTWGHRAVDDIRVRLRYIMPSSDSTRMLVEYWGRCDRGGVACLKGEFSALAAGIVAEEAVPQ